jgi:hypothetical protein
MLRFQNILASVCLFMGAMFAGPLMADYDYTFYYGPWGGGTQVRYWNPANPTWVYVYWISGASTPEDTRSTVNLPLPGVDYSATIVVDEAVKKLDARSMALKAVKDLDFLIGSVKYAELRDPNFDSLCSSADFQRPSAATLSLARILINHHPQFFIDLSDEALIPLKLAIESNAPSTLERLLKDPANANMCEAFRVTISRSTATMKQSWTTQRDELIRIISSI